MSYGAGWIAARDAGAAEIVDPVPHAVGSIRETFEKYPNARKVLPAMGYGEAQLAQLAKTIDASDAEVVVSGSPIDLAALLHVRQPVIRARYRYQDLDSPGLVGELEAFLTSVGLCP